MSWQQLLPGAFAFQTASFAVHPRDEERAVKMLAAAWRAGATQTQIEEEIRNYLRRNNYTSDSVAYQIGLFRRFLSKFKRHMRGGWVLYREEEQDKVIQLFSGRSSDWNVLVAACHIYEAREFNIRTQFMRAKKRGWPALNVRYFEFTDGALWSGEVRIGSEPTYVLRKADAIFFPQERNGPSGIRWIPKPPPEHEPSPTWKGLHVR